MLAYFHSNSRRTRNLQRHDLVGLRILATILNLDLEKRDPQALDKLKRLSVWHLVGVNWVTSTGGSEERKKVNAIIGEVRADLGSILTPEKKVDPTEAYRRIHTLIEKINEVTVKPEWAVEPVDFEWVHNPSEAEPHSELLPKGTNDVADVPNSFRPTKKIELLGYSWFFGKGGEPADLNFSRDDLYLMIRDALQLGVFDRLRICPQCKRFFVADDARQQFCIAAHRNEYNNKQRLAGTYFRDLRQRKRRRQIAKARLLVREGKSLKEIASKTQLSLRVLKRERVIRDSRTPECGDGRQGPFSPNVKVGRRPRKASNKPEPLSRGKIPVTRKGASQ